MSLIVENQAINWLPIETLNLIPVAYMWDENPLSG